MQMTSINIQKDLQNDEYAKPKFDASKQQWAQKIGSRMDQESKERKRRPFLFGKIETMAIARSVEKQQHWNQTVDEWSNKQPALEHALPEYDWSKPVWIEAWMDEKIAQSKKSAIADRAELEKETVEVQVEFKETKARVAHGQVELATTIDPSASA